MTTEVKKTRPINRLQSVYALRAYQDEQYQTARDAQKEGRPIAWLFAFSHTEPILSALGVECIYPENYGTVSAAAGGALDFLPRSQAEGFPNHLCGYMQNCFGFSARMTDLGEIPPEAPRGGMAKPSLLVSQGANVCDARNKAFQSLGRYLDAPLWVIDKPAPTEREALMPGAYERDIAYMVNELRAFSTFVEKLLGKKIDWDKVEEHLDRTIEMDEVWYEVTDVLRRARPCPMNCRDHYSAINASLFGTAEPERIKGLYNNVREEVKNRIAHKIAGINREEKYRAAFDWLGPWHSMNIFDNLAERGWNFPREDYHPPTPIDVSGVKDPLERIARYRYRDLAREIDFHFSPKWAAEIKQEIIEKGFSNKFGGTQRRIIEPRDYQLDGVILHTVRTCRMTSCQTGLQQRQLMDVWRVPSLVMQGDIVDISLFSMEDAMKKCAAFEETMEHYREVRKREGIDEKMEESLRGSPFQTMYDRAIQGI